jgi:hypothetical protein
MKTKPSLSSIFLAFSGFILMGLGLYFVFIRPPLLPEDPRFMGTSLDQIQSMVPGLLIWLRRVFWVMGGFMFTTGLLTTYIALTVFPRLARGARSVVVLAGLTSIGGMAVVNFIINSDFKWLLLSFNLPWIIAVVLSWRESRYAPAENKHRVSEGYWPCP